MEQQPPPLPVALVDWKRCVRSLSCSRNARFVIAMCLLSVFDGPILVIVCPGIGTGLPLPCTVLQRPSVVLMQVHSFVKLNLKVVSFWSCLWLQMFVQTMASALFVKTPGKPSIIEAEVVLCWYVPVFEVTVVC
jgi:hypothetical protein